MHWKDRVADYLNFTRRDRIAIISLLVLMLGIFILPVAISRKNSLTAPKADTAWIWLMKKLEQKDSGNNQFNRYEENSTVYQYDRSKRNYQPGSKGELFNFDPNKLTAAEWKRLGIRDKTIATILNYLSKGGKFRKPEDLQRIYGLFPDEYERIAPYIKIESSFETNKYKELAVKDSAGHQSRKIFTGHYAIIDINTADTTALIALPGIGNKLANRIINFRDKLGGFLTISQVGETFGLPDSTFQKIKQYLKIETTSIRKININIATFDELKAHPYIRYNLARPIVAYREQHGPFASIEDLKKIMVVTNEIFAKMMPYLTIEE